MEAAAGAPVNHHDTGLWRLSKHSRVLLLFLGLWVPGATNVRANNIVTLHQTVGGRGGGCATVQTST